MAANSRPRPAPAKWLPVAIVIGLVGVGIAVWSLARREGRQSCHEMDR